MKYVAYPSTPQPEYHTKFPATATSAQFYLFILPSTFTNQSLIINILIMPNIKLRYFDFPFWRAEVSRLALHLGNVSYLIVYFQPK